MTDDDTAPVERSKWIRASIAILGLLAIGLALIVGYREGERTAMEQINVVSTSITAVATPERLEDLRWYPEWARLFVRFGGPLSVNVENICF